MTQSGQHIGFDNILDSINSGHEEPKQYPDLESEKREAARVEEREISITGKIR